jgi:CHAT domain-containing protein/tetratricopeptide (TPR) repeat protein
VLPHRQSVLLLVVAVACGHSAPGTPRDVAYRPETLEAELARLPQDASPGHTIERTRILRSLGRHEDAVAQIDTALDGARAVLDWRGMSNLWRELGDIQIEMARPQDALDTYAKRLTNAKSLDVTRDRAFAQVDMAYAFAFLSQWTPAQHALEDAEVLAKSDLDADPETLEKMAYVREKLLARDVAIELFARARGLHARNQNATGEARAAIAGAYLLALERESSAPLDASLDTLAARSRDPEARARLLRYRGEALYLFDHQYPRCLELAREGQPIAERRGIRGLAKTMHMLASVCAAKSGDVPQAISTAEHAVAFSEDEWQSTSVPSARQAAGFEALLLYRHILSLDVKLPERERVTASFAAMEKARGRGYIDAAVRSGANLWSTSVEVPPLLARDKREIEAHVAELDKQIFAGKDDAAQLQRRRDALWALDDVKAAIAYRNPLITRLQTPRPATLERARDLLDDKTMLLAFFMTNEQAVAIAVTKTAARLFVIEGGPSALGAQIAELRDEALTDPRASLELVRTKAGALYRKLLGPVNDLVKKHERILVLPHGALSTLPLEALVDDDGKFVVETHVVTYSHSATIALEDARAKPKAGGKRAFVGIGDPVYDWVAFKSGKPEGLPGGEARGVKRYLDAKPASATRRGLERLPGTASEVKAIANLFSGDAKLYLRDQASEENVKAGILGGSRIIHIASHGLFETDYQALAFSMRPDASDDGFLMSSEIAELKLDADLVVLSACETGRAHEVLAEPVSGLVLALRTAGARRMIASLWDVDDAATVELMKSFYAPVVKSSASYGSALTEAKRKLVATTKWQHPFYWAAFVLVGN